MKKPQGRGPLCVRSDEVLRIRQIILELLSAKRTRAIRTNFAKCCSSGLLYPGPLSCGIRKRCCSERPREPDFTDVSANAKVRCRLH
jgi:hypothetical protein